MWMFAKARSLGWLITGVLLLAQGASAQTVYKCKDDRGNPVFSQRPCAEDAQAMEVKGQARSSPAGTAATGDTSDPALRAIEAGRRAACERREQDLRKDYALRMSALDRQIADYATDLAFVDELSRRKADLEREERAALLAADRQCKEDLAAPVPGTAAPAAPLDAGPRSWRCSAENGEVFYRHDRCPGVIRDEINRDDPNAGPIYEHRVRAEAVTRAEACKAIATPGRDGNLRDQQRAPGEADPCL